MPGRPEISDSLDQFAEGKLRALEQHNLRRVLAETERVGPIEVMRNGRRLISFSCNDYLNLSQHPEIKLAAIAAVERYGVGAGASRLVTGNHPLFKTQFEVPAVPQIPNSVSSCARVEAHRSRAPTARSRTPAALRMRKGGS